MEHYKCLGIYIDRQRATIAVVSKAGGAIEITDGFEVACPGREQDSKQEFSFVSLAEQIAEAVAKKNLVFNDVAVAMDCRLYRQQILHSAFTDAKQISQTVAFDAEEALAIDAAAAAVAFELTAKSADGSEVSVFAAEGAIVSEIILALQNNKLDPAAIEPDSICLRRIIKRLFADKEDNLSMWAGVSEKKCYIVTTESEQGKAYVRTFLSGEKQKKTNLLSREIVMTSAAVPEVPKPDKLRVFDTTGQIDYGRLAEHIGFGAVNAQLPKGVKDYDADMLELIIAAGAAIGQFARTEKVDFRPGFMPYQGKKIVLEKILKTLGISVLIIFITLGLYLNMKYYSLGSDKSRLANKFQNEYKIAMAGKSIRKGRDPVRMLTSEIREIKDIKSGILSAAGDDSVEARLTYLFEALNSVPKDVDLDIEKISVNSRNIIIIGSTNSRGYLKLFRAIDKHKKLSRGQSTYESKNNRDHFRLTVKLIKNGKYKI